MSKKLYVGNLPFSVDSKKLEGLFSQYGQLDEVAVITFKDSGKSKGFGFVTVADDTQAEKALNEMNGKEVEGRKIVVNEARPFSPDNQRQRRSFRKRF
jgi:RNA recognition motif-containing protein